ncbi:MAG: ABC transporter permease [Thermomicrobiales bacterium]|nr:ABC transporter permease [Thermomicrobiales bacterium]
MAQPAVATATTDISGEAQLALRPPRGERLGDLWHALRRNPTALFGLFLVGILLLCAAFPGWLAPHDPYDIDFRRESQPPSWSHPFGTNVDGQDILSRVIYGARIDLRIALSAVITSLVVGTLIGAVSAYIGGFYDEVSMRVMDILQAFPRFIFAMGIAFALGPGISTVIIATAVLNVPGYARLMRSVMLSAKASQYAMAARAVGANHRMILFKHLVPNCMGPIFVMSTLQFGWAILEAAGLSFIGLGVEVSAAEWGVMIKYGFNYYLQGYWWMYTFPGIAIGVAVLGFNLIGDGLQDVLDPRRRS